jgi:hypothetical protein
MNPVPRPMVYGAASILGGVCVLGLYLGIHGSLERGVAGDTAPTAAASEALKPSVGVGAAAAAVEAKPIQSDALPASAAPAQVAEAKPKPKPSTDDEDQSDEPAAPVITTVNPPPLYSPDEPAPQAPANENSNNTPPY